MNFESAIFYLYIAFVLSMAGGAPLFIFFRRRSKRDKVWRSLNLRLFHVALPRQVMPENGLGLDQLRERIGVMEKIYVNLSAIRESWWRNMLYGKPSFALELAVPHAGEEISFYVAVPRRFAFAIEKIIEGVFPDARVEPTADYNIFNPTGESVAASLQLKESYILPLRTYRAMENDPLRELANAFSKLQIIGEGASLQIVARPADHRIAKSVMSHAKLAHEGKSEVVPKTSLMSELFKILISSRPNQIKSNSQTPPEPQRRLSPREEEQVRLIESKGSHPLFHANIRVVASAPAKARGEEILNAITSAFRQFREPGMNEFTIRSLSGRALKRLFYQFSFRALDGRSSMALSSEELTSIFHFPNVPLETPKLSIVKSRQAPPPIGLPPAGLLLGKSVYRGQNQDAHMLEDDRRRHLYIIGQTGTGKSALMKNLIRQDISAGKGVCFIDPHGETVEDILGYVPPERMRDVIYFNPGDVERPMGLNMLEYDLRFPDQKTFVVNELFSIFQKLYGAVPEAMGPMFEQYFRNSTLLVMDDPSSGNTLLEIERVFTDKAFRDLKLSRSTNVVVKSFWRDIAEKAGGEAALQNMTPYITSKFDAFLANEIMRPIIAQERSSFNFREAMDSSKIILINLSKGRLGELNSSLIGLIMVGKIMMAALSRADILESERRDFYFYIDEFQNVTTKSIATILSEARKYRLNLIIAHQFLGQLDEDIKKAVFGNVGSIAAFRIGSDDAEFISTQFKPVFGPDDLLNIDNYNAYLKLLLNGQTSQPFNIQTYSPGSSDRTVAERIKEHSRLAYGRALSEVEAEIRARYNH